jgi:hypothetical protein
MERKKIIKKWRGLLLGAILVLGATNSFAAGTDGSMTPEQLAGKSYFEGSSAFQNGGPSCISCHSVKNTEVAKGGLLAKDLTDVYSRMGEGIAAWLTAPSFPAMAASYQNHPLSENERVKLTAFLKHTDEVKDMHKTASAGQWTMLSAGVFGLFVILILIGLIYFKQKRKMVKKDIFARQTKSWDAKF